MYSDLGKSGKIAKRLQRPIEQGKKDLIKIRAWAEGRTPDKKLLPLGFRRRDERQLMIESRKNPGPNRANTKKEKSISCDPITHEDNPHPGMLNSRTRAY